jgi:hypothetical protein
MQIWGLHVGGKGMNWEVLKGADLGLFLKTDLRGCL